MGGGGDSSAVDSANCATSGCGDTDKKEAELVSVCASEGCMSSTQRHVDGAWVPASSTSISIASSPPLFWMRRPRGGKRGRKGTGALTSRGDNGEMPSTVKNEHAYHIRQLENWLHQHARYTSFVHHHSLPMGQGKFIPDSTQWIIIRLASTMSIEDTAMYSDVAPSTIRRIIAHFKETGDVITSKRSKTQVPSTLCDLDIQVWLYLMTKLVVDMLTFC